MTGQGRQDFLAPPVRERLPVLILLSCLALLYIYLMTTMKMPHRIALVAGMAGIALFMAHPRMEILLYSLPLALGLGFYEISLPPFQPTLATLAGLIVTLLWVLDRMVWNGSFAPARGIGLRLAMAGLLFQTAAVFVSIHYHGQQAWNAIRDGSSLFLFLPLAFIVPEFLSSEKPITTIIRTSILTLLLVSVIGVLQYSGASTFSRIDMAVGYVYRTRVCSTLPAANVFAGYLEMTVPLALATLLCDKSGLWKTISAAAFALGFLSVLFTFSRGGFFMTTFAIAAVLVYSFRHKPFVPIVAAVAFTYVMATNAETFARQLSLVTDPRDVITQPTLLHRALTYESFWYTFLHHPLEGVGWGAQEFFWGGTPVYTFWDVRHMVSTSDIQHFGGLNSIFLNQALKGGILSVAALVMVILAAGKAAYAAMRRPIGVVPASIAVGLFAFATHQLVDNLVRWPQTNAFFWLHVGLLGAISLCRKRGGKFCTYL